MSENGELKGAKRDQKGRFVSGSKGGPGRGKKKQRKIEIDGDLLDAIEKVVRTGLGANELKDRLKAAGIGLRVQNLKETPGKDKPIINPTLQELIGLVFSLELNYQKEDGQPVSVTETLRKINACCLDCEKLRLVKLMEVMPAHNDPKT